MAVPAPDEQRHWGKWWEGHNNDILNSFWKDATHDKSIQTHRMPILIKPLNKHIKAVADRRAYTEVILENLLYKYVHSTNFLYWARKTGLIAHLK